MMSEVLAPEAIVTADPDSVELARQELAWAAPEARVLAKLAEGVLLLGLPGSYEAMVTGWRRSPPIFVRHLSPAQHTLALPAGTEAIAALRTAALEHLAMRLDAALSFSVQTRILVAGEYGPYDVNTALAEALAAQSGAPLDVRHPKQVVSVVVATYGGTLAGFLGLSPVADNLSTWAGGARRFAREEGQISRAEFKLLEALELFGVALPAKGLALDLGAAPGGWTRVLRQRGLRVVAVDPAALHPALAADRDVRVLRMTAEAYLRQGPERFDLLVNDMRMDARDSARLMVAYARRLGRRGQAIMTLKLPEVERVRPSGGRRRSQGGDGYPVSGAAQVLSETLEILREVYEIVGARQLFHNRSEVTVYLKRRQ
jgi:23S rRNA (cytidine2498-2'-O)-methyltransferase